MYINKHKDRVCEVSKAFICYSFDVFAQKHSTPSWSLTKQHSYLDVYSNNYSNILDKSNKLKDGLNVL